MDGVAFHEAKRQYFDDDDKPRGFMALEREQIDRISTSSATARVLLYDWDRANDRGIAGSVPARLALAAVEAGVHGGRLLLQLARPWIQDLSNALRGFDLDHRAKARGH